MFKKKYKVLNSRKHPRLNVSYLVKYEIKGHGEQPHITNIKDISKGGLRFLAHEPLPHNGMIKVNILVPPLERVLEANAQIVRVRRGKVGVLYYVAVSFLEMSQDDQEVIQQLVENVSKTGNADITINQAEVVVRRTK